MAPTGDSAVALSAVGTAGGASFRLLGTAGSWGMLGVVGACGVLATFFGGGMSGSTNPRLDAPACFPFGGGSIPFGGGSIPVAEGSFPESAIGRLPFGGVSIPLGGAMDPAKENNWHPAHVG